MYDSNFKKKRKYKLWVVIVAKKTYPADYEKCQQDMERILGNRKPTSSKRYIAPCGESYTFGAKITMPKMKKRKNNRR